MPKLTKRRVSEAQDLEESYRLADIVKQRQKTLAALKLKAGELVLDIGCGVGFLTHEMALQVGKSGKVIGLDKNTDILGLGDGASWIADQINEVFGAKSSFLIDFSCKRY